MEHVVFYPGADGAPAFRRANSLQDAVGYVEALRNSQDITEFSVYALTEVPVSLRAYYRVEVPSASEVAPAEAAAAAVDSAPTEAVAAAEDEVSWHASAPSDDDAPSYDAPRNEDASAAEADVVGQAVQFALGDSVAPSTGAGPTIAAPEPVVIRPVASEPIEQVARIEPRDQVAQVEQIETEPTVSSEILRAAAAEVANVAAARAEPDAVEADDRSEEWVAAATVLEQPTVAPAVAPVPDPTPVAVFESFMAAVDAPELEPELEPEAEFAPLAIAAPVEGPLPPSLQLTPFAVAPPVGAPVGPATAAFVADFEPAPHDAPSDAVEDSTPRSPEFSGDVLPPVEAVAPTRRSLGFFAR
jgi:hypothetical protein